MQRLEEPISGTSGPDQFLISRSVNYDGGLLDMNFRRSVFATNLEAKCLESLGVPIYGNRTNLRLRYQSQLIEICHIQRLVTEYNVLMGRLSPQEKGIFRNRLLQLERRLWNGVYKITWQSVGTLRSWINMCDETVPFMTKEVLEYKNLNKAISAVLKAIQGHIMVFEDMNKGKVETWLAGAREKVNKHVTHVILKSKSLTNFVYKIEHFLEVKDHGVAPSVWNDYVQCIEENLARAYENP